ncbi:hypothetical protein KI387_007473, partial [Taxus chinensis]
SFIFTIEDMAKWCHCCCIFCWSTYYIHNHGSSIGSHPSHLFGWTSYHYVPFGKGNSTKFLTS